ncbi:xanthine dehydrogenase-like isoform X1 [Mytilus galloprovincialis]|uniref:xanthine dehydrogenase-like isoform X1 n=1 Tax=Mytilus galloprovincialis TaxID=29158 RepID=UPI003F7CACCB
MDKKQSSKLDNCIVCPVCNSRHLFKKEKVDNGVFAANCECCGHFIKFRVKSDVNSKITVTINGQKYTVGNEYPPWTSLNSYLRKERISVGTKVMCREGGCGICMVEAKLYEPISDTMKSYPVNSCLCPLFMCDGLEITTIEGVNDVIPKRLAKYNGSQCGYCSPAQVMNMHALLDFNKGSVSMKEVEDAYDDVICRCTGYRPILDAMKSFAVDSSQKNKTTATDIEELGKMFCSKTGQRCHGKCHPEMGQKLQVIGADAVWNRPATLDELFKAISDNPGKKIRFVFGNTGSGVYKSDLDLANFDILMDLRGIKELYGIDFDPTVVLGAGLSITQLIDIFTRTKLEPSFGYFTQIRNMLQRVATTSIRSLGCWAGNLMLKHLHPEFQSDIYVSLEAADVGLMIADKTGSTQIPIGQFLKTDMTNKVIVAMLLQSMSDDYIIRMYKVAQRAENSHSFVNAGIRMKIDKSNKFVVKEKPCIVFSGIAKDFVHAVQTENYLLGKELSDVKVIQGAMTTLATELIPDADIDPVEPSVGYRKNVAMGFLYTYFLEVLGNTAGSKFRSGAMPLQRPLSSGQQSYDTKPMEWPLTEPLMKLEAMNQTTGKAQYINDIPLHKPLYAAFVTSTVGNAKLQSMDPSKALSMPGVLKFITAKDILGTNNCSPPLDPTFLPEEVLCSGDVMYAGQALGMIVADDEDIANRATEQVLVTYSDQKPPIMSIEDGIQAKSFFPKPGDVFKAGNADTAIANSPKKITGSISWGEQQHFQMETQISICTPTEDGMDVEASTQWIDLTQQSTAMVLGLPESSINVRVKRLGGAYGSKITRNLIVSAGCAIAAQIMKRTVKLNMDFHTNFKMVGRRVSYRADYDVGCTNDGLLNGIKIQIYGDLGYLPNENSLPGIVPWMDNAYFCENWKLTPVAVKTNKPINTACRAPGSTPAIFMMESIMENVAKELNLDPTAFRTLNLYKKGQKTPLGDVLNYCNIRQLVPQLLASSDYTNRAAAVQAFNQANRWKKKGLSVVPIKFGLSYAGVHYNAIVNIYAGDGSISIAHGGIEMGQGINTKVAQVCAYELGVPMDLIKIKANTTLANANDVTTGGSITSELCCLAVINCCQDLKTRMAPVKAKMKNPTWKEWTQKCIEDKVDLSSRYCVFQPGTEDTRYNSYGVTCTEMEFDVLTGQHLINRVDILYDCGESMNPMIDVGQVEGAFVMGLGYWLTESVKFASTTGQLLTRSTWEYKPPMAKDIPIDFRIQLLKNAPNPVGVLRSKAVGEPPLCMSCSALFALKRCVEAARRDIQKDTFFPLDGPATVDRLQELCLVDPSQFVI